MLKQGYAHARFLIFCDKFNDDFTHEIKKVLSNAGNALFELENDAMDLCDATRTDADRFLATETHRIKRETLTALQNVIDGFFDDVQPLPKKKPAKHRIIPRDVACRYIRIHHGKTEWIQTGPDTGYPILIDKDGDKRGMIDFRDRHGTPDIPDFSEMPF